MEVTKEQKIERATDQSRNYKRKSNKGNKGNAAWIALTKEEAAWLKSRATQ